MKSIAKLLLLMIASTSCLDLHSQQVKTTIQLADEYFATGEYYTAAHLYEQYLNPPRKQTSEINFPLNSIGKRKPASYNSVSRFDILFKQAESYRLSHYWQKAALSYKECADKNPSEYWDAIYWYAVCMRSLGKYSAAEESLKKYLSSSASSQYRESAQKELHTLFYIKQQLSRPDSMLFKTRKVNAPNSSEKGAYAPVHLNGNQFIVSSTHTDSIVTNGINPYRGRLFYAKLNNDSLEEISPVLFSATDPSNNQTAATISADGNFIYYSEWKKEKGNSTSSIYYAIKLDSGWSLPILLPSVNVNGYNSKQPFCTADGKYLFFSSDRPSGSGKFDIWYAPLNQDGTTGEPVNAGAMINSNGDEQAPFYHNSSSTIVFSSNGRPGMGGFDLYAANGNVNTWGTPENLGHPVNSPRDDMYFFAEEKAGLLNNAVFSSDRGDGCCLEMYSITKKPKNKRLTGILRDCNVNIPVVGASVVLKDARGKSWSAITDAAGKYEFVLTRDTYEDLSLTIKKESYNEIISKYNIKTVDESDLLTDVLNNIDLCIGKIPVVEPVEEKPTIRAEDVVTIYFDFDRSDLKTASTSLLDSIYNVLMEYSAATIQISGYTDGLGSIEYNNKLSDKRARACANYLIEKGIQTGRISFVSFGACCPVEMEIINGRDNSDGRSRNRRALINIKKD